MGKGALQSSKEGSDVARCVLEKDDSCGQMFGSEEDIESRKTEEAKDDQDVAEGCARRMEGDGR